MVPIAPSRAPLKQRKIARQHGALHELKSDGYPMDRRCGRGAVQLLTRTVLDGSVNIRRSPGRWRCSIRTSKRMAEQRRGWVRILFQPIHLPLPQRKAGVHRSAAHICEFLVMRSKLLENLEPAEAWVLAFARTARMELPFFIFDLYICPASPAPSAKSPLSCFSLSAADYPMLIRLRSRMK
jgi:hypothetical protein